MIPDQINQIAQAFIQLQNQNLPAGSTFMFGIGPSRVFADCYYFDFAVLNPVAEYTGSPMGGAPGFVIDKTDLSVRTIAFWELSELEK